MSYQYILHSTNWNGGMLEVHLRPAGRGQQLAFEPGQYATLSFKRGLRRSAARCFSITSRPGSDELSFAMRVEGKFTKAVSRLKPGARFDVQGPFGDFTINPDYDKQVIMLAGGSGITPFISMLRSSAASGQKLPVVLLASNRYFNAIPFQQELADFSRRSPYIKVRHFITGGTDLTAAGVLNNFVSGRITGDHLSQITAGRPQGCSYFVCGPKAFADSMHDYLANLGVSESRIITESFSQADPLTSAGGPSLRKLVYGLSALGIVVSIAGIAVLDLVRSVPRLASAQNSTAASNSASTTSSYSAAPATSSSASDTSSDSTGAAAPTTITTTTPATSTNNSYYQPPTSSVS